MKAKELADIISVLNAYSAQFQRRIDTPKGLSAVVDMDDLHQIGGQLAHISQRLKTLLPDTAIKKVKH